MKKTQRIELLKNISVTKVSFISILMFVALGIAVFAGLTWSAGAVKKAVNIGYDESAFHDIEIVFPYGFSEENLDELRNLDGIDEVEGTRVAYRFISTEEGNCQIKLMQIGGNINKPMKVEGKLPTKKGEIAVEPVFAEAHGLKIGDTVTFDANENDGEENEERPENIQGGLATTEFTITGFMETPIHVSTASSTYGSSPDLMAIDGLMFITEDSFNEKGLEYYNGAVLRSDSLRGMDTYSEEYKEAAESLRNRNSQEIADIAGERYDEIKGMQEDAIADIEAQLADALNKINNGGSDIAVARTQVKRGRTQVEKAKKQVKEAEKQFAEIETEATRFVNAYDAAKAFCIEVAEQDDEEKANYIIKKYEDGTLEHLLSEARYFVNKYSKDEKVRKEINELIDEIIREIKSREFDSEDVINMIREIYQQVDGYISDVKNMLAEKRAEIVKAKALIADSEEQLTTAEKRIRKAERELAAAKSEYDEKNAEAEEYIAALPELIKYDCNIRGREQNLGYAAVDTILRSVLDLRFTMAALFLIVGLLVCYSAVSRMIHDQTIRIGTKKALGLMNREVTASYLSYSGLAVITGAVLGFVLGIFGVEKVMVKTFAKTYIMTSTPTYWEPGLAIMLLLIELILIVTCTWFACRSVLKKNAVDLLAGAAETGTGKKFFEDWGLWKRLPLFSKTVVRNSIADKRRVFATLVGVTGCTALVVCAIMMSDNINNSLVRQFDKVTTFDNVIYYLDEENEDAEEDIKAVLKETKTDSTSVLFSMGAVNMPDGSVMIAHYFVPTDEEFEKFVHICPIEKTDAATDEGVWMNVSYAQETGAKPGDEITMLDGDGQERKFVVSGFFEYYLTRLQLVISPEAYREAWGETAEANAVFINAGDDIGSINAKLNNVEGYVTTNDYYNNSKLFYNTFTNVFKALVAVYLVLAIVMALLVLLNLYTMFVEEKKKELIVMMINGFGRKAARAYIYRDTILLTVIGIILGLVLGTVMGAASIHSFESTASYFIKDVDWRACLIGTAVSGALSFLMVQIAMRRIDKFELSDINK